MGYFGSVGIMIASVLLGLILLIPVLRVLLPLARARFSNPVCQAVYRLTNPVIVPLSKVFPTRRGFSSAALLLAWLVATLAAWLMVAAMGAMVRLAITGSPEIPGVLEAMLLGLGTLLQFTLSLYFWMIVLVALMSFFSPDYGNPLVELVMSMTRPVLKIFERIPLRIGNIGLSPLWATLTIQLIKFTLTYLGMPSFPF